MNVAEFYWYSAHPPSSRCASGRKPVGISLVHRKSNALKSFNLGGQIWSLKGELRDQEGSDSRGNWIVSRAAYHVVSSCRNRMLSASMPCNFGTKKLDYHVGIVNSISWYCSNPHQTVIRCGCICLSTITYRFSEPQMWRFCRLAKP